VNSEPQKVTESFEFTGPFEPATLVLVLVVISLLLAIVWFFESRVTGRRISLGLLCLLRIAAFAIVLWILAGPSLRTDRYYKEKKTVALLVDSSDSMRVTDPPDSPTQIRWSTLSEDVADDRVMGLLDRAATLIGYGAATLGSAAETVTRPADRRESGASLQQVGALMEIAREQLSDAADAWSPAEPLAQSFGKKCISIFLPETEALAREFLSGAANNPGDTNARIQELQREVEGQARNLGELSDRYARDWLSRRTKKEMIVLGRGENRLESATRLSGRILEMLADRPDPPDLAYFEFAEQVERVAPGSGAGAERVLGRKSTDLDAALKAAVTDAAGSDLEAVFMLTDGGHQKPSEPARTAALMAGTPVYTIPIGNSGFTTEVLVHHADAPRSVILNDSISVTALIDAYGCDGELLRVELVKDDEVVDVEEVSVSGPTFIHKSRLRDKARRIGRQEWTVRVEPVRNEEVTVNNRAYLRVNVVEDSFKVLLVDRIPRWEHRYLRHLFKRDEHMEYGEVLLVPGQRANPTENILGGLPSSFEEWTRYRAVILGDLSERELPSARQEQLEQFVSQHGGVVVVIAGSYGMPSSFRGLPLEALLPVSLQEMYPIDPEGYQPRLTTAGRLTEAMILDESSELTDELWRRASRPSGIYDISPFSVPRPTSHTLMYASPFSAGQIRNAEEFPAFVSWQRVGRGRVIYISSPSTYRLRYRKGDLYHHRFWGQLLRWALYDGMGDGSRLVKIETAKLSFSDDEPVHVRVRLQSADGLPHSGAMAHVVAEMDGQPVTETELKEDERVGGLYHAEFSQLPVGSYEVSAAGADIDALLESENPSQRGDRPRAPFTIEPNISSELRDTRCNLPLLRQISEASGGLVVPPTAIGELLNQLDLEPVEHASVSYQPQWSRWSLLWIFVALLSIEWVVRKLLGLS